MGNKITFYNEIAYQHDLVQPADDAAGWEHYQARPEGFALCEIQQQLFQHLMQIGYDFSQGCFESEEIKLLTSDVQEFPGIEAQRLALFLEANPHKVYTNWNYTVVLEYPEGYCEEYKEDELLTIKEHKKEQILYGLGYFTGSQVLFKHWFGLFRYTQGVKYIADEAGAYWLIDAICSHQKRTLLNKYPSLKEFQIWRLQVELEKNSGLLICEEDTDQPVLSQEIPYTDFPLEEIKFFLIDKIVLLPGEY